MSSSTDNNLATPYATLPKEGTWVEYLRTRLLYSFKRVEELPRRKGYRLHEPRLLSSWTPYHNYWYRGYSFYVEGKIADCYRLSSAGESITKNS